MRQFGIMMEEDYDLLCEEVSATTAPEVRDPSMDNVITPYPSSDYLSLCED